MITSTENPKIKRIRRLLASRRYRYKEKSYVIEGTRWLSELAGANQKPQLVLVTNNWLEVEINQALIKRLRAPIIIASDQVMAYASDTETPAGVLAVIPMAPLSLPKILSFLLILDRVTDPGNLGTMMRSAAAAGADGIILGPGCVDPYNPKVVRGSMGAHLRLPLLFADWQEIGNITKGMAIWLASPSGGVRYDAVTWQDRSAIVVGSEAVGHGHQANEIATGKVTIPIQKATDSLNAAIAASILLFEVVRQRSRD